MDVARSSNENKLSLCKKYFFGGCAFLPFMWAINAVWFAKDAFVAPSFPQQKQIKTYVVMSAVGALACLIAIVTWYCVFLNKRGSWGLLGDELSFYIPKGAP